MSGMKLPSLPVSWPVPRVSPLLIGAYAVWATSVVASMSALYDLAVAYGGWNHFNAIFFPGCLDLYWITALSVAMDSALPGRRRVAAGFHALIAISASAVGQLLYHELHAGDITLHKPWSPLMVGVISTVPLLAGAALTHLVALGRARTVPAKARRTVPSPPRNRAKPETDRANPDEKTEPESTAETVPPNPEAPRQLKPGGRPDPIAIQAARDEWHAAVKGGHIHNDRTLEKAVNDRWGYKVIGRTSAGSVIAEETDARRRLA